MITFSGTTFFIIVMLVLIITSLGAGLYYLVKDRGRTKRTVSALTFRIILSLILFFSLIIAFAAGWIKPHSLINVSKDLNKSSEFKQSP